METDMNTASDDLQADAADALGHRLRIAIRMIAGGRRISLAELGRRTGIGDQKLLDRLNDTSTKPPTRLSVEEAAKIAAELNMSLTELIQVAEDGQGLPLSREFELIDGGGSDADPQPQLSLHAHLLPVH